MTENTGTVICSHTDGCTDPAIFELNVADIKISTELREIGIVYPDVTRPRGHYSEPNERLVKRYMDAIELCYGVDVSPVDVIIDADMNITAYDPNFGDDGSGLYLLSGFHCFEAHKRLGLTTIFARMHRVDLDEHAEFAEKLYSSEPDVMVPV